MATNSDVDSSSHFVFKARTDRQTDKLTELTDANDHPTYTIAMPPAWTITL